MLVIKDKTKNKFIEIGNIVQPLKNDLTQVEAGKYALDAAQGYKLNGDIANRLEKNQGAENSGKYLKVGEDGNVTCDTVSGGKEEWVAFNPITLEESVGDIYFTLDADKDLIKFNFYLEIPAQASASANVSQYIKHCGRNLGYSYSTAYATSKKYLTFVGIDMNGSFEVVYGNGTFTAPASASAAVIQMFSKDYIRNYFNAHNKKILGISSSVAYPIGTKACLSVVYQ